MQITPADGQFAAIGMAAVFRGAPAVIPDPTLSISCAFSSSRDPMLLAFLGRTQAHAICGQEEGAITCF
jgi:hypothetical protein